MVKKLVKAITGSSGPKKIHVETPKEPDPTPLPDLEAERRASMRAEQQRRNSGRASTLLSEDDEL